MIFPGGCHCGTIKYELDWPGTTGKVPARKCGCSYCTRFRGTWTSHPDAKLNIRTGSSQEPGRYRFGTGTADFLFCSLCGVTIAAVAETHDGLIAALNVNTLDPHESLALNHTDTDFEEESLDQRLERRAARWIGNVTLR